MDRSRLNYLLDKQAAATITMEEQEELYRFLAAKENEPAVKGVIDDWFKSTGDEMELNEAKANEIVQIILGEGRIDTKVVRIPRRQGWYWIAAACLVLLVGGLWFVVERKSQVTSDKLQVAKVNDVPAPKDSRAVITLADGRTVLVDSINSGTLAIQEHITVEKAADGRIVYQPTNGIATKVVYNILTNPRGSKVIHMQFTDGSHVWLNAGSSVKYPVAFIGNERKVKITGEAYFEVAHDPSHPFVVSKGETSVTVLGTHFNVNAYDDEDELKVTLLEGSVKVSAQGQSKTIKPGEQAVVGIRNLKLGIRKNVDVEEVMAWKTGKFQFNKATLPEIMRQVARWYDVDVQYNSAMPKGYFHGDIDRNVPASQMLKILAASGVNFKIEDKTITILP